MAKVHKSSVFEGQDATEEVLARKQLVMVVPPISYGLAWHGANAASVHLEHLDSIEADHSDHRLGSLILLSEVNNGVDDAARTDEEFRAEGSARLTRAVANIATLASMGTSAEAQTSAYKASLDVGMPIIFPGSTVATSGEVAADF